MVIYKTNTWDGRIDGLSRGGTELTGYDYLGQRVAWRAYNTTTPVVAAYGYDMLGRVTDIDADSSRVDLHYSYVPQEHNIAGIRFDHRTGTPYNSYGYDDLDRVTQVTYLNNDMEAFPMDDLGNRVGQVTQRDGVHTYSVDELTNRYTAIDANSLAYDDAGSLTQDKDGYRTTYDYENRPVRIAKLDGQTEVTVATFEYDALGRRIRKVDVIAGTTSLYYYSDTWQVLAEYDGSGVLQASYTYGNYIDEVLLMRRGGADYFYLHDHLYSPAAILNNTGAVVERYEYDVYGTCHIQAPDFSSRTASLYGNAFLFQGHMQDSLDSGSLKPYDFRYRAYDSFAGRWMQQDPMQYVDGMNLYEYVSSNAVQYTDPKGESLILPGPPYKLGWYKLGTDEPGTHYFGTAMARYSDWRSMNVNEKDYHQSLYIKEVEERTAMQVYRWYDKYHYAAILLDHYKMNRQPNGAYFVGPHNVGQYLEVYTFHYGSFINRYKEAQEEVLDQAANVKQFINMNLWLTHGMSISAVNTTMTSYPVGMNDPFLAIAGHETWHKAENITCNGGYLRARFTTYLRDVYDFEQGLTDLAAWPPLAVVSPGELQDMHKMGRFRAYFLYGKASAEMMWKYGDVSSPLGLNFQ